MRPNDPRRARASLALTAVGAIALGLTGAVPVLKKKEPPAPKVEETITNLANISSTAETKLEGVGLVVGLDETGADPPQSYYRDRLVADMRKAGIENPNTILKSPHVAMVIVKLGVPVGTTTADRLDAEVEVPPGAGTKSLAGGYLLSCRLRRVMVLGGQAHEDHDDATVKGPVMTGSPEEPDGLKVGRVLGGAHVRKEVPFQINLKEERKSVRLAAMIEAVVNQRFPRTGALNQKGAAHINTFGQIELKVPPVYHHDQDRFFRVVRLLPLIDTAELRTQRTGEWARQLLDPATAGVAALRLEGLGPAAVESLKAALAGANPQVRFFAAEALAYLNDPSGADVLAETALSRPEFRAYALTALSATDQPVFHMKLRKLMDEPDVVVRYGAFNALRTLAGDDPFLGRVRVLEEPEQEDKDDPDDSMALAISRNANRRRREDPFALYLVDCDGPPMVHVARTRRCEVVVFGSGQKLLPPVVLGKGPILLNAADGDVSLEISKIVPSQFGDNDAKVLTSMEVGDVLRKVANMGATYPDVVMILQAAARQRNLPGPLVIDAVPGKSPVYVQAAIAGKDAMTKTDDALKKTKLENSEKSKRRGLVDRLFRRGDR